MLMAGEIMNIKSAYHKVDIELDPFDSSRGILSLNQEERYGLNGRDLVI